MEKKFKTGIRFQGIRFQTFVLLFLSVLSLNRVFASVTTINFTYTNRQALLADGWDFLAKTAAGATRNTEVTNGGSNAVISYNQNAHPGEIRIPLNNGDLWLNLNNSQNSLFRTLPTNWTSVELDIEFSATAPYQQLNLALYQDDDNYIEVARTHYPAVSLVYETNGNASVASSFNVTHTVMSLRLDRDPTFGQISSYYSADGTNWVFSGKLDQEFIAPRLCIWTGGGTSGSPKSVLKQLRITTSTTPFPSSLFLSPQAMAFNSIAGQSCTNVQRINIYRRGPDAFNWTLTKNASWLAVTTTNGTTPGICDVSVNTAGLTNGVYEGALTFTARGSVTNTSILPVTLIINASNRVSITTWKDGKKGAMTVWIDDSEPVMYDQLIGAGFKGTYALMGPGAQSAFLTTYHNNGMELGSHSETHPCNPQDGPERRFQIETNIANILASTPQTSERLVSFAWPCGANTTRERVWSSDYFIISRGYNWNQLEDTTPKDFTDVKSYNSHEHPPFPPADFKTIVDAAIAQGKWANLTYHTMSNDDGSTAYAVGKDIWVGTGGDVTRYILQRDRTILTNYQTTGSEISFDFRRLAIPASPIRSFESSFKTNDTITFKISVTNLPPVAAVHVNGVSVPHSIRISGASTNLFFDVIPQTNLQSVVVSLSYLPVLTVTPDAKTKVYRSPNPTLTGSITGMTPGDGITATYSTTAANNSPVGNYPITPTLSDPLDRLGNYFVITNISTLTITKSNAPTTLNNLSQTYNGAARIVTATTIPPALTVNLTYNGNSSAPTNAGSYTVIGTISAANYQGATTNTLVVTKSNAPISLSNLSQTYSGTARTVTATTVPSGLTVSFTYNGSSLTPTNAGSYTVIGIINDLNHQGAATNTLIVGKSNASVTLENLSQPFSGTGRIVGYSTVPTELVVQLSYNGSSAAPTNAGSYTIIGIIFDSNHQGSATNTLFVTKSNAPISLENLSQTYDGTARSANSSTIPSGLIVDLTYDGNVSPPTNAGSYTVIGNINDLNHQGSTTNALIVAKSNAPISLGNLSHSYNRTARSATASTTPPDLTVTFTYNGTAASPTNTGEYVVIGTINDSNHQGNTTNSMQIVSAPLSVAVANTNRLVGGNNPIFSGVLNGVFAGDDITLTLDSPATPASPVGSYPIIPTLIDPEGRLANYDFNLTNGVLSIVGQPQFTNITRTSSGSVRLDCNVYPGRTYDFQFKESLADTGWTTFVSNQFAATALLVITNETASTNLQRYYRAVDVSSP